MKNIARKVLKFFSFLVFLFTLFSIPHPVYAVCPVCTVAVGAGLGLSRYFGIDDAVSSIWIGGLILSSGFWMADWLNKKKFKKLERVNKKSMTYLSLLLMYAVVLIPLKTGGVIGHPLNTIMGIDKIIFGTAVGSAMFIFGMWVDKKVRKLKGKQMFNYQKVAFPVISLVLSSLIIYYYGGYLY
jgi:hypothetical protein